MCEKCDPYDVSHERYVAIETFREKYSMPCENRASIVFDDLNANNACIKHCIQELSNYLRDAFLPNGILEEVTCNLSVENGTHRIHAVQDVHAILSEYQDTIGFLYELMAIAGEAL